MEEKLNELEVLRTEVDRLRMEVAAAWAPSGSPCSLTFDGFAATKAGRTTQLPQILG